MTFPTRESVTSTDFASDTTSHAANLPATVNAGDLLLALIAFDNSSTTMTTPSGWTLLIDVGADLSVYAKVGAGTEGGGTADFVTSNSQQGTVQIYRISGWAGVLSALALGLSKPITSPVTGLGLPTASDNLWIVAQAKSTSSLWGTAPTGYTSETKSGADSISSAAIASAVHASATAFENFAGAWLSQPMVVIGVPPSGTAMRARASSGIGV
jgi:hypothetical protein